MVQIGDTPNPELRIITSTFNKVLYKGRCIFNPPSHCINVIPIFYLRHRFFHHDKYEGFFWQLRQKYFYENTNKFPKEDNVWGYSSKYSGIMIDFLLFFLVWFSMENPIHRGATLRGFKLLE